MYCLAPWGERQVRLVRDRRYVQIQQMATDPQPPCLLVKSTLGTASAQVVKERNSHSMNAGYRVETGVLVLFLPLCSGKAAGGSTSDIFRDTCPVCSA